MVSSSLLLFLFVLFTFHFGTHGQVDAKSDDHCSGGLSHNGRRCAKGCTLGFATADNATATACGKNILKPALLRCKKPAAMKKTKVQDYSKDLKCDQCRAGWDGDLCTRENIARKRVKLKYPRLQDDDHNTCLFVNGTKHPVKLKRKRENTSIVDLFLSSDVNQKANFGDCVTTKTSPCKELASPSEKVIRLNCSKPSKQAKQLIIDCTARLEQLYLCEVKVYACDTFWFGVETGCSEPCNCQDGVSCNPVTGACPPGKDIHSAETDSPDMTTVQPATATTTSPATPPVRETQTMEPLTATTSSDVSGSLPVSVFTAQPSPSRAESRASSVRPTSQHPRLLTTLTTLKSTRSQERDIDAERKKKKPSLGSVNAESGSGETNLVPVMVGVSVLVLLIASALAGLIIYRNRRNVGTKSEELLSDDGVAGPDPENNTAVMQLEMKNQSGSPHSPPAVRSAQSKSTARPVENVYANMSDFSATTVPVPVDKFRNHVSHLNNIGGFQKEFEMLPRGILAPVLAADSANKGEVKKNRFKDISPYDEFRVVLSKEKDADSDYINATYIDGFAEVKAYIAAQGPLPDTVEDFWHMVWVEGCGKIVMLTNLCENAKVKCEQYWPPHEGSSVTFGRYTITSIKVTEKAHFTHRMLDITKDPSQSAVGETHRQVHQFHFTAWIDHGVPCAVPLVCFWSTVTLQQSQLAGPLLVHCSAGIGRTGTVIALDILTHQVETTGQVSVFRTVQRLRKQRVNMVQTLGQYRFLHEVVAEWLASQDSQLIKDDLAHGAQWTEEGQSNDQLPAAVRQKFVHQFQLLDKLRPEVTTDQVTTAMLEENTRKNRSTWILPMEQYRVYLKTSDSETSGYINAIFLPSLRQQQGYIVTQLPLEDTVSDFWHMVHDWGVKVIVRFMDAPKEQDVELYPLEGQQTQHGSVSVETRSTSTFLPGVTCYTLHLHTQISGSQDAGNQATAHAVSVYCVDSPGALSLTKTVTFLSLVKTLLALVTAATPAPVVFQCFDGAGLSCVMCGLMMAAEALEVEGRMSPFLLTRLIHTAQPRAFRTVEQYEFLVRCLLHRARGITDADDITESDENREVLDDTSHIYGNV